MKIKTATLLAISSAFFLSACSYTQPAATTTATPTAAAPTPIVTASPTSASTNVNDLNAQLNATVDDGGQADLNQLQKDATGL